MSTTGDGPVLLVLPEAPAAAEAWRMLETDPTPRSVTFEGFYELLLHSKGYTEAEVSEFEEGRRVVWTQLKSHKAGMQILGTEQEPPTFAMEVEDGSGA